MPQSSFSEPKETVNSNIILKKEFLVSDNSLKSWIEEAGRVVFGVEGRARRSPEGAPLFSTAVLQTVFGLWRANWGREENEESLCGYSTKTS